MRLHWLLITAFIVLACPAGGQEVPADSAALPAGVPAGEQEEETARQLRIYSETLYQGSSMDVRVDAAVGLLLHKDSTSADILTAALEAADKPQAAEAVCRAIIKSRGLGKSIAPAQQFVKPLMTVLTGPSDSLAMLAGEALLLYPFLEVREPIRSIVEDPQRDPVVRLRGIYALQLRTETEALRLLIRLLDDPNAEVARAAEKALQESFGIPVGTNRQVWSGIMEQLQNRSPEAIRRERLLRQEMKLREMQAERDRWRKLTLAAMDKEYEQLDAAAKNPYLKEKLTSDLVPIRIWAMQKLGRLTTEIDPEVRGLLLALVGHENRDVRFQAARTLSVMSALNPAERLLEQFRKETDPQVALAQFEALGEACFFAFSPGSPILLAPSIRDQTLEIAADYLQNDQSSTAKSAAEVLRKLLELNGLSPEKVNGYFTMIRQQYQKTIGNDETLRADLLAIMARLSSQGPHRVQAGQLFKEVFLEGLKATGDPAVRLSSVIGLVGIDKNEAFRTVKEHNMVQDSSPAVREVILEMATAIGGPADLEWLFVLLQGNGGGESYWTAFRSILQRQKAAVCLEWAKRFESRSLRTDWTRAVLQEAERKAVAAEMPEQVFEVRTKLLQIAIDNNLTDEVLLLGGQLFAGEQPPREMMVRFGPAYLQSCLLSKKSQEIKRFLAGYLAGEDAGKDSELIRPVQAVLESPETPAEYKEELVNLLMSINPADQRPQWKEFLVLFSKGPATEEIENKADIESPKEVQSP